MAGSPGVPGRVALGAIFDPEVDAFLILILSVYVPRRSARGCWRSGSPLRRPGRQMAVPWLRKPLAAALLAEGRRGDQGIVLTVAAADFLPTPANIVGVAAVGPCRASFGHCTWLLCRVQRSQHRQLALRVRSS